MVATRSWQPRPGGHPADLHDRLAPATCSRCRRGDRQAAALGREDEWLADSVVACSFGDGSLNHSTAQGALNTAGWFGHQERPLPVLFVCEDNGLAISVPSAPGWVEHSLRGRAGLRYEYADGTDPLAVYEATEELAAEVREVQRPAVLHLRTARYGGHAGTDVEAAYRTPEALRADRRRPARRHRQGARVVRCGHARRHGRPLRGAAPADPLPRDELAAERHLESAVEVIAPLAPRRPTAVADAVVATAERAAAASPVARTTAPAATDKPGAAGALAASSTPSEATDVPSTGPRTSSPTGASAVSAERLTLAESINRGLAELLVGDARTLLFGEDVGLKGGVTASPVDCSDSPGRSASSTRSSTSRRSWATHSEPPCRGSCRSRRSSISPTCTTPSTSCAARRRRLVLLAGPVPQRDGGAHRRARLPEGLRRALPQRHSLGGLARHPGRGRGGAVQRCGRAGDAAHVPCRSRG